jgi:hypothetical protein
MMLGVMSFLKMTMENALDFKSRRLPTLDTELWVGLGNKVLYSYFEKPMASNQVLQKDTAMPEDQKMSSLNTEVVRRMQNTSELLPIEDRVAVVDNFCQKLANSGYRLHQIRKIVVGGLIGYEKRLEQSRKPVSEGWRALHENAAASQGKRDRKKLMGKQTWFKDKERNETEDNKAPTASRRDSNTRTDVGGSDKEMITRQGEDNKEGTGVSNTQDMLSSWRDSITRTDVGGSRKARTQGEKDNRERGQDSKGGKQDKKLTKEHIKTTTVMFVDNTVGGELAKRLRGEEDKLSVLTGFRVKIVESGGTQLKQMLSCVNPWSGVQCNRTDCQTCQQGDEVVQDCFRRNILYESTCMTCEDRLKEQDNTGAKQNKGRGKLEGHFVYVGESSRSIYERSLEHMNDAKKKTEDSHIWKHWAEHHPNESMPRFSFKVIRTFQDCLTRQVAESVRIDRRGGCVLNSKTEFSRCKITRLVVDTSEWQEEGRTEQDKTGEQLEEDTMWEDNIWEKLVAKKCRKSQEEFGGQPAKRSRKDMDWGQVEVQDNSMMRTWLLEDNKRMEAKDNKTETATERRGDILAEMARQDRKGRTRMISDCFTVIRKDLGVSNTFNGGDRPRPGTKEGMKKVQEGWQEWEEIEAEVGELTGKNEAWEMEKERRMLQKGRKLDPVEGWKEEQKKKRIEKARKLKQKWIDKYRRKASLDGKETKIEELSIPEGWKEVKKENHPTGRKRTSSCLDRIDGRREDQQELKTLKRARRMETPFTFNIQEQARGKKRKRNAKTKIYNWTRHLEEGIQEGWKQRRLERTRMETPERWMARLVAEVLGKASTEGWKKVKKKEKEDCFKMKRLEKKETWQVLVGLMDKLEELQMEIPEGWSARRMEREERRMEKVNEEPWKMENILQEWEVTRERQVLLTGRWMEGMVKKIVSMAEKEGWMNMMKKERKARAENLSAGWKERVEKMDWQDIQTSASERMEICQEKKENVQEGWKQRRMERKAKVVHCQNIWQEEPAFLMDWMDSVGLTNQHSIHSNTVHPARRGMGGNNTLVRLWEEMGRLDVSTGLAGKVGTGRTTFPVVAAICTEKNDRSGAASTAPGRKSKNSMKILTERKVAKGKRRKGSLGGEGNLVQKTIQEFLKNYPVEKKILAEGGGSPKPEGGEGGPRNEFLEVWGSITRKRVRLGQNGTPSKKQKENANN